jgi:maltose O-acetyltransferase
MPKTELEKMLANEPYLATDPELKKMYKRAQNLLHLFNGTHPDETTQRHEIIQDLFGAIGDQFTIQPPFRCDYGCNIHAGKNLYINYDCIILDCNKVYLGDNLLIAPRVQIYTAYHSTDPQVRKTELELAAAVTIGSNVWIGGGAIICPGVTIGDNTTIGAGSVVVKDIPANVVAVGNPCKVLRAA